MPSQEGLAFHRVFPRQLQPFLIHSILPSGQKAKEPASPPASLEWRTTTHKPGPELRTATPSPALRCSPQGSLSTHSTSSDSSNGVPGGIDEEKIPPCRAA